MSTSIAISICPNNLENGEIFRFSEVIEIVIAIAIGIVIEVFIIFLEPITLALEGAGRGFRYFIRIMKFNFIF